MDFPQTDLWDEQACDDLLVSLLHPDGLVCPRCHRHDGLEVHRRDRVPLLVSRWSPCFRIFDAFTDTILHGTKRRPGEGVLIWRGFAPGVPTAQRTRERECDRSELLKWRHRFPDLACHGADQMARPDPVVEADELSPNAGEKRRSAL
jgi:hypothetical protein